MAQPIVVWEFVDKEAIIYNLFLYNYRYTGKNHVILSVDQVYSTLPESKISDLIFENLVF